MRKKKTNFEKFHSQLDLPFLETDSKLIREILQTLEFEFGLKNNSKLKFIDLGAGNGTVVIFTALNHKIKSYGIEINQQLVNEAKSRIKSLKKDGNYNKKLLRKIKIKLGDFYLLNLKDYDFIYIYSLPSMQKFLKHVFRTAKKGAIIISHRYRLASISSLLDVEYILKHKKAKQEIYSFIYRKIL
jgi:SAM-dependent methyltransferase